MSRGARGEEASQRPLNANSERTSSTMRRTAIETTGRWHREAIAALIVLASCLIAAASADAAVAVVLLPAAA
jgi:hypothetical protein